MSSIPLAEEFPPWWRKLEYHLADRWVKLEQLGRYYFAAQFVRGKIVLDCACGRGMGTNIFQSAGAKQIAACDLWPAAIELAKKQVSAETTKFYLADAECLPFFNDFADVYISLETIEHIRNDKLFLAEAKRVLRPNGIFICSTPNRLFSNPGRRLADKPLNKLHIREYSPAEFLDLLKLNFKQVDLYGQNWQPLLKMKFLISLGKYLPAALTAKINQVLKLPRLIYDTLDYHKVTKGNDCVSFEYLVAVCK
jgi:SAM-dependent methyltransferase